MLARTCMNIYSPRTTRHGGDAMSWLLRRKWRSIALASSTVLVASALMTVTTPASAAQTIGYPTFTNASSIPQPSVGYSTGNMLQSIYDAESGGTDFWSDRLLSRSGTDPS